jgi:hypothetical protein
MNQIDRRARVREYKEMAQPAGIYRVRNTITGKSLIGTSLNLPGILNRQRFQLGNGSHPDGELQADWQQLGPDAFEFSVLDQLKPRDEPGYDPTDDLNVLKAMWVEKLAASGEVLYGEVR